MNGEDNFGFIPDPEPAADFGFVEDEVPAIGSSPVGSAVPVSADPVAPGQMQQRAQGFSLIAHPPVTVEEERREAAWQRKQVRDENLRTAFRLARSLDLGEEQQVLQVSKALGVTSDRVRPNLTAFKATAALAENDPDRWAVENPEPAKLVTEQPHLGPLVVTNKELSLATRALLYASELMPFGVVEQAGALVETGKALAGGEAGVEALQAKRKEAWESIGRPRQATEVQSPEAKAAEGNPAAVFGVRFREARQASEKSRLGFALLQRQLFGGDTVELEQQLHDLELQSTPLALNEGPAMQLVSDAAMGLASSADAFAGALERGAWGAVAGGLGTLALTRNPALAMKGVQLGAGVGARYGAAEATWALESGSTYLELRGAKDEDGRPLDRDVVAGAAIVAGAVKTGIELAEFELQLKTLDPLKAALQGDVAGLKQLLGADSGLRATLSRVARSKAAAAAAGEPVEEFFQEGVDQGAQAFARSVTEGRLITTPFSQQKGLEAAGAALPAGAAMGSVGPVLGYALQAARQGREERGAKQLPAVMALAQDKSVQAAPEAFAQMVAGATADLGAPVTAVYVDAQAVLRYYQDKVAPDDAARELDAALGPDGAQKVAEAAVSGQRLVVPLETVLGTWGASDVGKALVQDSATTPSGPTLRERTPESLKATEEAARAMAEAELARAEKERILDTQAAELERQLVETGTQTKEKARAAAALVKHLVRTAAKDFGRTVAELFPEAPVVAAKGDEQAVQTSARLNQPQPLPADLVAHEAGLTDEERLAAMYVDQPELGGSGLHSERAWNAMERTPGMQVGFISFPDAIKPINDHPRGGHDVTNRLVRVFGSKLGAVTEGRQSARVGPNLVVEVKDQADLDARVRELQAVAPEGTHVLGTIGATLREAQAAEHTAVDELRKTGGLPALRKDTAFDRSTLTDESFPGEPAVRTVPPELAAPGPLKGEAFVREVLMDPVMPGVRSREGYLAAGPKKFSASLDLVGLQKTNDAISRAHGNGLLDLLSQVALEVGAGDVFFAHFSGDEFAMKSDNKAKLQAVIDALRAELQDHGVPVTIDGKPGYVTPVFRDGVAEGAYGKADQELNRRKSLEPELVAVPVLDDLRRAGVLHEGAPRREGRVRGAAGEVAATESGAAGADRRHQGDAGPVGPGRLTQDGTATEAPKGYTELPEAAAAARVIKVFLNKSADVSTVVHEVAHAWLELYGRLAERPDAPARVKETYAAALKAMGVESRAEVTREHHEKWARSFEQYLLEGQAPKAELRSAFNKMKRWMMAIYRTVAGVPGQALSDGLRRVFDAMLATEDELEAFRAKQGPSLFATAKEAGVSEEEWQARLEAERDAVTEGGRKAELRAVKDALRVHEAWWQEGLKKARGLFADEYEALPARRAQLLLQGKLPGVDIGPVVLERAAVEAVIGKTRVPGLVTAAEGVRPAEVAELAGFPNAASFLGALAALKPKDAWVEEQAQGEMAEQHPGVLERREELQTLVADGLASYTEKRLTDDVAALRKRDPTLGAISVEVMRRAAALMVERRELGKLAPGVALAQERAAAVRARKAAAAGEWVKAHAAVREQLLNAFLHRELLQAREERGKVERLAQQLGKTSARERLGKASPAYRDAVDYLLEAVGLREPTHAQDLDARALEQAVAQMNGDVVLVGDPDWLEPVSKALEAPWKKLTVEQMRAVRDALVMLRHAANQRATVLDDEKRLDRADMKAAILADAASTLRKRSPEAEKHAMTALERIKAGLNAGDGYLLSGLDLLRDLTGDDPNSATWRALALPLRRAEHREADLLHSAVKPIVDAFEAMPPELRASLRDSIDGDTLFPTHRADLPAPRRVYELLMLGLNAGNESNLRLLTEGRGITIDQVKAALDTLPASALDWIQAVWDATGSLKEEAFALEQRVTGLRPRAIEPVPLQLKKNGTLRGGYFPAKAITALSRAGELQQADTLASLVDPSYTRPVTAHGYTKSRAEGAVYPLSFDPGIIYRHLYQVAHDIAFREALQSVGSLVMDPDIKAAFQERLGVAKQAGFLPWLKAIGGASGGAVTAASRMTAWVKSNMASALLSGFTTALGNLGNIPAAVVMSPLKAKHMGAGLVEFLAHPVATRRRVLERSGQLRTMQSDMMAGYQRAMRNFTTPAWARGLEWTKEAGMALMRGIDVVVNTSVWAGAERQALAEGHDAAWAVRFADDVVTKIASQSSPVERAAILNDAGVGGLLTVFYGYLSIGYRAQHRIAMPLFEQDFENAGVAAKAKTLAKVAGSLVALYIGLQILPELLMSRGPEDGDRDEEDPDNALLKWRNWFLRKLLVAPLSLLPVLPFASVIEGGVLHKRVNPKADPVSQFAFLSIQALIHVLQGEPKLDELARVLGIATGQPVRLVGPGAKYLFEVTAGEREVRSGPAFVGGVLRGEKDSQPDDVFTLLEALIAE